jgi:hypothetical protein
MKKVVELNGTQSDLKYLSVMCSSSTLCIVRVEKLGKYVLWHSKFDSMQDDSKIYECATNLIGVINGCARLRNKNFCAAEHVDASRTVQTAKGLYEIISADRINTKVFLDCPTAKAAVPSTPKYKSKVTIPDTDQVSFKVIFEYSLLNTAMNDEKVEEALRYFANFHDWFNLYKVFEAIEGDPKDCIGRDEIKKIDGDGEKSERKSHRFSGTANVYRHHHDPNQYKLPKNPMSLEEADDYLEGLMKAWCFKKTYEKRNCKTGSS